MSQSLHYQDSGAGNKIIVLLHGFPEDSGLWRELIPLLGSYRVLAFDLPGSGKSAPMENISIDDCADLLAASLKELGIDQKVLLAGHSMGGYIAMAFAEKYPEHLLGLSMIHSGAGADDEEKKDLRRRSIRLIESGGRELFVREMIPNLFAPGTSPEHKQMIEEQIQRGLKLPAASLVTFYNAMINRPDRRNVLDTLQFPVQWVFGAKDNIIPVEKGLQQAARSNVSFVSLYNGTGHMSMLEDPGRLADDLNSFAVYCFKE